MKSNQKKNNVIHLKDRVKNGFKKLSPNSLWNSLREFLSMLWNRTKTVVKNPVVQYAMVFVAWIMYVHAFNIIANSAWLAALPPVQGTIVALALLVVLVIGAVVFAKLIITSSFNLIFGKYNEKPVQA